jgi:intracellular multiplication protein IcmB
LWPYQPGSSEQISWVDLIYARSGSGKSVLSNALNLAVCLSPGLDELPYIGIIDIGPSSKGLVSLLQHALPLDKQSQILYHKLQFSREHACNPFDTMLGARSPTSMHHSFLVNFISLLLLDPDEEKLPEDMSSMVGMIIEKSYQQFKDEYSPKEYIKGIAHLIDDKLQQFQAQTDVKTWWQVADRLFENQEYELARTAHYQAMPTLSDTIAIANDHSIRDIYVNVNARTGENYIQWYTRKIASIIKSYPHLSNTTVLQIAQAKIIVIDLDDVAKQGSKLASKQTSIAYMQARQLIAQHFFISADDLSVLPEGYYAYHHAHIKNLMNQPKRLVYDEFHRTQGIAPVREQVLRDMREGRKWKVQISLASQSLHDFDGLMLEFATSIFILDAGTQDMLNKTASVFGLNETQKKALQSPTGPQKSGVNFLAQFITKAGVNTQLLTATFGAVELWALTTTAEDAYIRDHLYELTKSPAHVRQMLAERFQDGTVKSYVEILSRKSMEKTTKHLCDDIIHELFERYMDKHAMRATGVKQ